MFNQKNIDLQSKKRIIATNLSLLVSAHAIKNLLKDPQWIFFEVAVRATLYTLSTDFLGVHYGHEKKPLYQLITSPEKLENSIKEIFLIETFEKETLAESIALTFGENEINNVEVKMKLIELEISMTAWTQFITKKENSTRLIKALADAYLKFYTDSWVEEEKKLSPLLQDDLNASIDRITKKLREKLKQKGFDLPEH